MNQKINILGKEYEILDALEYVTMADSFVKNKIGKGHGEAKLYVGNESNKLDDFFEDFNNNCFFLKKDFDIYLRDAKTEFKNPQQVYVNKEMPEHLLKLINKLGDINERLLNFEMYRVDVAPPRVYINAQSEYYNFMREIGLPNISYLSIMKLAHGNQKSYYFKVFIDYKCEINSYAYPEELDIEKAIKESSINEKKKQTLINARVGQGEYRNKLLEDCPFCPFTKVNDERMLIASHIKPWAKSDDKEKTDPKNGFMFTPTYDKLFDRGFITFDEDKTLIVSPWISPMNQKRLGIYTGKSIDTLPMCNRRETYLEYHREHIYKG